ncbi:PAS domain-containing protein [Malaciobacter mytili]|uniref:helix-turn-helix transcriptional regulator n=1 Tax=Malaciobacter mytili TaxID=603050 RepID=UPI003BAFFB90
MNKKLNSYKTLCDAIGKLFYPHVEVVLHDLELEKLVYIVNAFSKRKIGDTILNDVKDIKALTSDIVGPYEKINIDGKRVKTVSTIIRDENKKPIGMICINFDIEIFDKIFESIKGFLNLQNETNEPNLLFSQDWRSHTNSIINRYLEQKNKKIEELKTKDKKELIYFLNEEGIFSIRNVVAYLCEILNISRATIYKWLKELN